MQTTSADRDGVNVVSEAGRIGEDVAGPWADAVDRDARFPSETMDALGASGLLGAFVPAEWGGPGATLPEASRAVSAISRHCASSGLIFAMHLIQVAYLDRHGSDAVKSSLFPRLLAGDLLLGSANSEVGLDGARRTSVCALEPIDGGYRLEKQASTVSYGEYSDAILATTRRSPDSPPNEQVLVVCVQPTMELTPTGTWDTLGLRGTCSHAGLLRSEVLPKFVLGDFAEILALTSLPVGNVLLGSTWVGIAESSAAAAHASVRADARRNRGADPHGGPPLDRAAARRAECRAAAAPRGDRGRSRGVRACEGHGGGSDAEVHGTDGQPQGCDLDPGPVRRSPSAGNLWAEGLSERFGAFLGPQHPRCACRTADGQQRPFAAG